jgi:hypothetical protein
MQTNGDLLQLQKLPLQIPYSVMSLLYLSNSVQYLENTNLSWWDFDEFSHSK